jgi:hypothetical protein
MKKKINIPLYFGELTIIQVKNLQKIEAKYKLPSVINTEALVFRNHDKNGYSRYVMAFEKKCSPMHIAHEALHLVALIYEDRGMVLDTENDEPQCYLIGWIVGKCHKYLKI